MNRLHSLRLQSSHKFSQPLRPLRIDRQEVPLTDGFHDFDHFLMDKWLSPRHAEHLRALAVVKEFCILLR